MAWTYNLKNDDTTLQLNDGTNYTMRYRGFSAPAPRRRVAMGGANLFRHGSDLLERMYENRVVTLTLKIEGTDRDDLITNINAINALLERAAEFTITGLGSQVKLTRQWDSATNSVDFHVLHGVLDLGQEELTQAHVLRTVIPQARVILTCHPFAIGSEETIENFVADPSFEIAGTALADWTQTITATGTTARDTAVKKYGGASLKIVMTDSGGSGQIVERSQTVNDVDAGEIWSFQRWYRVDALSNCKVSFHLIFNGGSGNIVTDITAVDATKFSKLTHANRTISSGTTSVTIKLRLQATAAGGTGTVYFDGILAVQAAAVPTTFASSRDVRNHFDDDGQAHINYVDLYDVPGDAPALLQVKLSENEAHDEFWAGARHAGRQRDASIWLEGESGTGVSINTPTFFTALNDTFADGDSSDAVMMQSKLTQGDPANQDLPAGTYFRQEFTITSPPKGQYRVLVIVEMQTVISGSSIDADKFQWGLSWTYGGVTLLNDTTPDTASFVSLATKNMPGNSTSDRQILDLGTVTIPPIKTPEGMTEASLVLKLFNRITVQYSAIQQNSTVHWRTDAILLLPIDMGVTYVSKTSGTDILLLDSRSTPQGVWFIDSSNVVQSFPSNQLGGPSKAHPDGTRIYVLTQDANLHTITHGFKVSVTVVPRYLLVA